MYLAPAANAWILYGTTAAMLVGILVIGLWPLRFHPANNVNWIVARNGIRFGANGSVVSSDQFRVPATGSRQAVQPGALACARILFSLQLQFLQFQRHRIPCNFNLRKALSDLFVIQRRLNRQGRLETKHMAIAFLFPKGPQRHSSAFPGILVARPFSSTESLRRRSSDVRLTCESLAGTLVLANSPERYDPWQGNIFALAIYHGSLDAGTSLRHYRAFSSGTTLDRADLQSALAVYDFSERGGRVIHDQTRSEPDLTIPEYYSILYPPFLTPPWKEYTPNRWYVTDLAINVVGFVPRGFLCLRVR